ncbi:DNA-binding transcriptional response regulator, NtrC family, contains REC, AAA-type ATPase, and a Fis-type DNA-binding domains [Desulfacinum hydrothermale DSM 13146]|uniref:DNA-binding transcriptional response regulator, NtrC family, contains REC, AAA-type ATPase, and a Fis-type DNA-binding domains n=1 Tax=Desulfacinum hydrothermale DSM 13146 TaxID=1121390 RepID=A0A1W1XTM0_9BACT|nr:sigma-54 dependent transcriptional regulator [Desulfacinum hydrothermale]SMC27236.1 DNA-binding transcriptional response regulator, NtrC family, contains REC, AAA-type ATPase, and a Fis-type DNA-binding domains [Desulfacinum hydrothermale DSM 13146]
MRAKQKILIIDDEAGFRGAIRRYLEKDYSVEEAETGAQGLEKAVATEPDLVLLDIGLPDESGLDLLERLKGLRPSPTVVMVTAYEQVRDVVEAMRKGAFDYLVKPVDLEEFELTVRHALENASLRNEVDRLRKEVERLQGVNRLVGSHPAFLEAQRLAVKSAQSADAGVLLQGESGVGKELFARLIHSSSPRSGYPFVALNCAVFSPDIIESELFGYERGAFTGARAEGKQGLLEAADGGTLFLDEVIDLPAEVQAKLLRVLEEQEYYSLGSTKKKEVDIRVVSACNRDLWEACESGEFRKDLFFRLATIRIFLPPLRERREDIIPLARFFLEQLNDKYMKRFRDISPDAQKLLRTYSWPGNVRELRNAMERVVLMEDEELVLQRHLHFLLRGQADLPGDGPELPFFSELPEEGLSLEEAERMLIQKAYEKCGRNKAKTARYLRIPRHVLVYRMKKYGLEG